MDVEDKKRKWLGGGEVTYRGRVAVEEGFVDGGCGEGVCVDGKVHV